VLCRRGECEAGKGGVSRTSESDEALRAQFARRERWLLWPAAAWIALASGIGIGGIGESGWLLISLGAVSGVIAALAMWAWRSPGCGKELEVRPKECKHCGLVLR
jgi:hypothetical protein